MNVPPAARRPPPEGPRSGGSAQRTDGTARDRALDRDRRALVAAAWACKRGRGRHRLVRYHSLAVAIVFTIATLFLAWNRIIGHRSWA